MKRILILLFVIFTLTNTFVYSQIDSTKVAKRYFGLSLQPNYQGLISYAIIEISDSGVVTRTFLSRRDWLHQIVGIQQSYANPDEKNILKDAGIDGPDILDELWKLRYSEPPYEGSPSEKGWAAKVRMPSEGQMDMLRAFGIKNINDYFWGENLLKLLNAMEDAGWVSEYQNK